MSKKEKFVTMSKGDRIEVPVFRKGRPSYAWVQGWNVDYRNNRSVGPMRFGEARDLVKTENEKPIETISFTRINNDGNGNPRYVCHYLNLLTQAELDDRASGFALVHTRYAVAIGRANSIGGRKFHNKSYGGGIVFQSYSLQELAGYISQKTGRLQIAERD